MLILLHTSKTMREDIAVNTPISTPLLLEKAKELVDFTNALSTKQISECMAVSEVLAKKTQDIFTRWSTAASGHSAVDSFVGDIYSGLQAGSWTSEDAAFAQDHLVILSGLYGLLRPLDDIRPYRLEMGYKLPDAPFKNMYAFWGDSVAEHIAKKGPIVNLTAVEYAKVLTPYLDESRMITPAFMTVSPKTGEPTFVTVHAKVARGAFANWIIKNRVTDVSKVAAFNDLNYRYDAKLSTPERPVFVCKTFGGLGLSVRLRKASVSLTA